MSLFTSVNCEDYVNTLTHNSETPLYFAARNGHLRAVKWLIKGGADINRTTNELSCPLFAGKPKVPRITITDHVYHVYFPSLESCYIFVSFFVPSCRWWVQRCGGAAGAKWSRSQRDSLSFRLVLSPSSCLQGYSLIYNSNS